jgi:hypothetical protein
MAGFEMSNTMAAPGAWRLISAFSGIYRPIVLLSHQAATLLSRSGTCNQKLMVFLLHVCCCYLSTDVVWSFARDLQELCLNYSLIFTLVPQKNLKACSHFVLEMKFWFPVDSTTSIEIKHREWRNWQWAFKKMGTEYVRVYCLIRHSKSNVVGYFHARILVNIHCLRALLKDGAVTLW